MSLIKSVSCSPQSLNLIKATRVRTSCILTASWLRQLELWMICIPPLIIHRYANAHVDDITTKYSKIVEMTVLQENVADRLKNFWKTLVMRGLLNSTKFASKLMPISIVNMSSLVMLSYMQRFFCRGQ